MGCGVVLQLYGTGWAVKAFIILEEFLSSVYQRVSLINDAAFSTVAIIIFWKIIIWPFGAALIF